MYENETMCTIDSNLQLDPTKDRKGFIPTKRSKKNIRVPKRTYLPFYTVKINVKDISD